MIKVLNVIARALDGMAIVSIREAWRRNFESLGVRCFADAAWST